MGITKLNGEIYIVAIMKKRHLKTTKFDFLIIILVLIYLGKSW